MAGEARGLGHVPFVLAPTAGSGPHYPDSPRQTPVLNLAFVLAAWLCAFGLPRTLAAERAEGNT
jgi:hypothetical protein